VRRWKLTLAATLALAGFTLPGVWAAAGQADQGVLVVRQVDSSDPELVDLQYLYSGPADIASATLTENGDPVEIDEQRPLSDVVGINVALLIDTSDAMDTSGALVAAKDAAKAWVRERSAEQKASMRIGVYAMGDSTSRLLGPSTNEERILNAIDQAAPPPTEAGRARTALWSTVRLAADDLAEFNGQANLAIFTAQDDNVSSADQSSARGAVSSARASVFAAGYTGAGLGGGGIQSLVNTNGGVVLKTDEGTQMGPLVTELGDIVTNRQYVMSYPSAVPPGGVAELSLSIGDLTDDPAAVSGTLTDGVPSLHPEVTTSSGGISFLQSNLGLLITVVLILVAAGGLAYGLTLVFVKDDQLSTVLQPYSELAPEEVEEGAASIVSAPILQRAVALTEQMAADRGLLARAEGALERANLPLRAGEALFFYAALVVVGTILGIALTGGLVGGLLIGGLMALIPIAAVSFIASRRRKKFMALLPDTLQLLSGTLRAGYSLMQGVEAVSQEVDEPMGLELRRVVTESRLGRPLEEALEGTAERMDSPDFGWAVMAIRIQREVGGNLSELLLTVAETMTARERLRRDVASLTAEGRVSAIVLGILPIGLGFAMYVLNPEYIGRLFETGVGNVLLIVAAISMLAGFYWMKKIIDIEI
jgi:tight adherence protein B